MIEQQYSTFKGSTYNTTNSPVTFDKDIIELIIEQNNTIIAQNIELLKYIKSK